MEIEINQYSEEEEKTLAAKLEEVAKQKQLLVRLEAFAKKEGFTDLKALLKQVIKNTNPTESTTKVKAAKPAKGKKGKGEPVAEASGEKIDIKSLPRKERPAKFKELFKTGKYTSKQIAEMTGYSEANVAAVKKKLGLTKKTKATKKKKE